MMTHSIVTNISSFPALNIKITGWMEQSHTGCRYLRLQRYNGMDNRYNRHNRRKYSLKVHIVLVTKYRKQLLRGSIADDVKQKIYDICNSKGYGVIAMETDKDHIHFLISYDTTDRV